MRSLLARVPFRLLAMAGLVLLVLLEAGCSHAPTPSPGVPRHVILVVLDTVRADHMSIYGYGRPTTPLLETRRSELLRFADVKPSAPWTVPSHGSIFTGRWPAEHGAQWGRPFLSDDEVTLAEVLQDRGFTTIGLSSNPFLAERSGFAQGFARFEVLEDKDKSARTATVFRQLPALLEKHGKGGKRLFLFLNLMDAHMPYFSAPHGPEFGLTNLPPVGRPKDEWQVNAGRRPFGPEERTRHTAAYDSAIRALDDRVDELFRLLEREGVLEDTLVVLTSDHGEGLGAHPEIGHNLSAWEEQLNVPLLVRFPAGRRGGELVPARTTLTALAPSILDWLGIERPPTMRTIPRIDAPGELPVLADYRNYFSEQQRGRNLDMARTYPELAARTRHRHVLYCGQFKLHADSNASFSFFDLAADPDEQNDLLRGEPRPEPLGPCLFRYRRLVADGRLTPFDRRVSPEEMEKARKAVDAKALRSLGYVH